MAAEKGLLHLYFKIVKAIHADCTDSETHSKALENYPPEGTPFFGSKRAFLGMECYLSLPVIGQQLPRPWRGPTVLSPSDYSTQLPFLGTGVELLWKDIGVFYFPKV